MDKNYVVLILFLIFFGGCNDDHSIEATSDFKINESVKEEYLLDSLKISKGKESISVLEACHVAQIYNLNHEKTETRATFPSQIRKIRNVLPILNGQQDTLMYVINFEEGFTIVSATKIIFSCNCIIRKWQF